MQYLFLIISFIVAVLLSRAIIPYILLVTYKKRLFDPLDSRKVHQTKIPRLGGIAFMPIQVCVFALTVGVICNFGLSKYFTPELAAWVMMPMVVVGWCGGVVLY